MAAPISHFSSQIWSNERWLKTFAQYFTLMSLHPLSRNTSSLLLLFSSRFCRFSSLSRASSSSCCWRHLWKFSTTTPTNMLSTKKLTMSRNEMKNSSIQGLWFITGCREKQREKSKEERTGGSTETQKVKKKKQEQKEWWKKVRRGGEEEKERAQTKRQCKYWVSTKTASSVSSHLFIHLPFFSFLCTATPHSWDISPFTLKQTRSSVPKNDTKKKEITGKYSLAEWVVHLPDFHFLIPHTPALPPAVCETASPHLLVHTHGIQAVVHDADPAVLTRQHKERHQRLAGWYAHNSALLLRLPACKSRCLSKSVTNLSQIVEVVFPPQPAVTSLQTLSFIGDVTYIDPVAVEEFPFKQLRKCEHREKNMREDCNLKAV